jgi:hypothetical protein
MLEAYRFESNVAISPFEIIASIFVMRSAIDSTSTFPVPFILSSKIIFLPTSTTVKINVLKFPRYGA